MKHEIEDNQYQISEEAGCPAIGYQDVTVCVPVAIKPFGQVGNATVQCLGKPTVLPGCSHCPGKSETVCKFTISQKLRIQVPVIFGARAEAEEASVDCGCAGKEETDFSSAGLSQDPVEELK